MAGGLIRGSANEMVSCCAQAYLAQSRAPHAGNSRRGPHRTPQEAGAPLYGALRDACRPLERMIDDADQAPAASRVARRVLDREAVPASDGASAVVAEALQRVCARTSANLRDAMGVTGCDALVARAVSRAKGTHPVLTDICRRNAADVRVEDLRATIEAHGAAASIAAVEALLVSLIDILSRLIGEDMAIRLIEPDIPRSRPGGGARVP